MINDKIWQAVLGEMEVVLPKAHFATWFRDTSFEYGQNGEAIIFAPNIYSRNWLKDKYEKTILDALKKADSNISAIDFKFKKQKPLEKMSLEIKEVKTEEPSREGRKSAISISFNKDYTFETFVVGNNNSLAYAVAREVAANPGKSHNPLFIYGGVGLGKTHLAQAIGREIQLANKSAKLVYVSCETFTNDFINSIASKKMAEFKHKYREVDVLIVDDIQFLSSKEGSQQEFFHTFNALHQRSRQIILTADKTPQAIPALEGRLASRFGGGMTVDVQPPDFETRMAILTEKCKEKEYLISNEVIEYIAKNISSNIRELEGALNRLAIYCRFNNTAANAKLAEEVLHDSVSQMNKSVDSAEIISGVCKYFSISREDVLGKGRRKETMRPRQIAIYLLREQTNKSLPEIGKIMGGKDHTTILHSQRKIFDELKTDAALKSDIEKIREILLSIN